jgi:hypothetical protein
LTCATFITKENVLQHCSPYLSLSLFPHPPHPIDSPSNTVMADFSTLKCLFKVISFQHLFPSTTHLHVFPCFCFILSHSLTRRHSA